MAINWQDPATIVKTTRIFGAFLLVLCGIATWEVLSNLSFDISIFRGKRPFKWPMLIYFTVRLCMLLQIYSFTVNRVAISEVNCPGGAWVSKISDAIGTCGSSFILVLRTVAVWHPNMKIKGFLGVCFLGQIAVWAQTFQYSRTKWDPSKNTCIVLSTAPRPLLIAVFAYTMAFDFVILLLCTYRLIASRTSSTLANILLRDGMAYFCAAFGANFIQMIFACLQLSPVMNIIGLPFAHVVSVIACSIVFRNVFMLNDSFYENARAQSSTGATLPRFAKMGGVGKFSSGATGTTMTEGGISLGDRKAHDISSFSTKHGMVDEVDRVPLRSLELAQVNSRQSGEVPVVHAI